MYEKELRRSRKEAYKSSSAVIKLQEELKATRNSLRITQSGLDAEKQKVQRREQDTFNAQYQLAAAQEDLDKLKAQLRIVEEEKVALKQSLKDEEVARVGDGCSDLDSVRAGMSSYSVSGSVSLRKLLLAVVATEMFRVLTRSGERWLWSGRGLSGDD